MHKTVEYNFLQNPEDYEIHQAIRILEKLYPDKVVPGETAMFDREVARFTSSVDYKFPPSVIKELKITDTGNAHVVVTHLGLAGAHGVLPLFVTDLILEQERRYKPILRDFLDIFNHRLVSIHSRVRRMYRPAYTNDVPSKSPANKVFYSLLGLGQPSLRGKMELDDEELLPFTGMLSGETASRVVYEHVLAEFCGAEVQIQNFKGEWLQIDESEQTAIGVHAKNNRLGENSICGTKAYNPVASFIVFISKLVYTRYDAIKPGGREHSSFVNLLRFLFNDTANVKVNMSIYYTEIPGAFMTSRGVQLGHLSWIGEMQTDKSYASEFEIIL